MQNETIKELRGLLPLSHWADVMAGDAGEKMIKYWTHRLRRAVRLGELRATRTSRLSTGHILLAEADVLAWKRGLDIQTVPEPAALAAARGTK